MQLLTKRSTCPSEPAIHSLHMLILAYSGVKPVSPPLVRPFLDVGLADFLIGWVLII